MFLALCSACHTADGTGNQMLGAPNLDDDIWLYGVAPRTVRTTIDCKDETASCRPTASSWARIAPRYWQHTSTACPITSREQCSAKNTRSQTMEP